jgi:DHA1 family multidrug resistance protein-like MFS transporter
MLGFAFGISEAGAIAGPVFGGVAAGVGRAPAFVGIAVCALVLALITARFPAPQAPEHIRLSLRPVLGSSAVRIASWITLLLAMMLAGISVLAPLQQHRLGTGPGGIAAIFGVAAALGVLLRPAFGRLSDRRGPVGPVRAGLLVSFALMFSIPWAENRWAAGLLVIAALLVSGLLWAPAMVMLSDACVAVGGSLVTAVGVMNLAWPPGNVIGSAGGAAIAQAAGQRWAYAAMALPLLLTSLALSRKRSRASGGPVAVPAGPRSTRFEHRH